MGRRWETVTVAELLSKSSPKFRDFANLRVGGMDEYSRLPYDQLRVRINPTDVAKIDAATEDQSSRAKIYRWILRGLTVDLAIRKHEVDLQIGGRAQAARREEEFYDDPKNEWTVKATMSGELTPDELHDEIHG